LELYVPELNLLISESGPADPPCSDFLGWRIYPFKAEKKDFHFLSPHGPMGLGWMGQSKQSLYFLVGRYRIYPFLGLAVNNYPFLIDASQ